MYTAELENPLTLGLNYSLVMEYKGLIDDKLVGFYRSSYKTIEGETRFVRS